MHLLFVGNGYAVAEKPAGLLSEPGGGSKESFFDALQEFLEKESGNKQPLFPVHRLDRAVGGVMIFATDKGAAARLSLPSAMRKFYLAVVKGRTEKCGTYRDFLYKDPKTNKTFIAKSQRRGVREAALHFKTLASVSAPGGDAYSLVLIALETGRSHQIRVQFASRRHPIVGDGKYGGSDNAAKNIALFSCLLAVNADLTENAAPRAKVSAESGQGSAGKGRVGASNAQISAAAGQVFATGKKFSAPDERQLTGSDGKSPFALHENCHTYCCFPPQVYPWTLFSPAEISAAEEIFSRKSRK